MGGSPFDPILSVTHGLEMNLLSLRFLPLKFGYSDESGFSFRPSSSRGRVAIYLSIYVSTNVIPGIGRLPLTSS